ncbi:DNA-binding protein WhiA [Anaerotalea alkaliphila]|uniref:Probable cell division protein WhiA n=1 Tax=Anaerotalea alkaliphila TaxID=2662126 RepID=A0A7X5KMY2_9FIRM|nr:DNA-binding protein WhiA [Anaerotalea alkaliphila]NDL67188.1 DNA-binding protein WhiA [Anaerotalea alkaliphila]
MSFSAEVKHELSRHMGEGRHCQIAEVAAMINMCGKVHKDSAGEVVEIKLQTENPTVARKYFTLLKKTFNMNVEIAVRSNMQLKRHRTYYVLLKGAEETKRVLQACKLWSGEGFVKRIHPLVVQTTCCKRAYIRGAFLAAGSISDPEKTYHLEFVDTEEAHSEALVHLLQQFEVDAKTVLRKKYHVVYLKEGRQIVDLLNIMEAHVGLMSLENTRILKEMRNNVNRIVNCETANINKTVSAAVRQTQDIQLIEETVGLSRLPEALEELARIRLEYSEASLKELGEMLGNPIGKSGVNHRLRKISEYAEQLRAQMEE